MDVVISDQNKIEYTYKLKKGISKIHGAYSILENMDYPEEILEEMRKSKSKKSKKLKKDPLEESKESLPKDLPNII